MTEYRINIPDDQNVIVYLTDGAVIRFNCDYEYTQNHSVSLVDGIKILKIRIEDSGDCYLELTEDDSYYKKYVEKFELEEKTTSTKLMKAQHAPEAAVEDCAKVIQSDMGSKPLGQIRAFRQLANVDDEPENIDKDFLRAQLSVKHQSILRNVLAIVSSIAVAITFLLEKLGVI